MLGNVGGWAVRGLYRGTSSDVPFSGKNDERADPAQPPPAPNDFLILAPLGAKRSDSPRVRHG